ncbi:hypothetical protein [Oceanithermus sp.]|uniref:hypothetical protein n=1 Tax=Oceanithermus sp. TaxID=2268145 RepID=UPI00257AEF96|nr:hypothetical protein [Oceanithermus sp.]
MVVRSFDLRTPDQYPEGALVQVMTTDGKLLGETQTDHVGQYLLSIEDADVGDELRVKVTYSDPEAQLTLGAAKRANIGEDRYAFVPTLVLVNPAQTELEYSQGSWSDDLGDVEIEDPQGRFSRVWARAFDPEFDRPFFPGNYRDAEGNKIISNGFLFATAQDANGQQVTSIDEPVTVYFYIPTTHRYYLRDISPGNGLYEVPMYLYDEEQDTWVRRGTGLVVDADYQPIPESDEDQVTTDPDYGELFVKFEADHFSTWNVDHPLPPCR